MQFGSEQYERLTDRRKVEMILEWYDSVKGRSKKQFKPEFTRKMKDLLDTGFQLTSKQSKALDNVIKGWKILDYFNLFNDSGVSRAIDRLNQQNKGVMECLNQ